MLKIQFENLFHLSQFTDMLLDLEEGSCRSHYMYIVVLHYHLYYIFGILFSNGEYNGIAIWMVYDLDKSNQVSFGVLEDVSPGTYPKWNMERKQGLYNMLRNWLPCVVVFSIHVRGFYVCITEGNLQFS